MLLQCFYNAMASLYPTVGLIVLFLLFSAFFSASETALFSIPRERIYHFKRSKRKNHQWIFSLLQDGQRTLLCILFGNLIVNVTVVGFIHSLLQVCIPGNTPFITLLVATGIILLFGEIIPKNIALRKSESIAVFIAPFLYHIRMILHPVLSVLQKINTFFLSGFSRHLRKPSPYITLDEFKSSLAESTRDGALSDREWQILRSVLEAADTPITKYVTHRLQLPYISGSDTVSLAIEAMAEKGQTVCCVRNEKKSDEISGLVYLHDVLKRDRESMVQDCMVQAVWVPQTSEIADLIGVMLREEYTNVCVHDEFGMFVGIFSLQSGLHEILHIPSSLSLMSDKSALSQQFDGFTELRIMKEWIPPSLHKYGNMVRTLNGLILMHLGKIPKTGERFAIDGWNFYIIRAQANYIESILITKRG